MNTSFGSWLRRAFATPPAVEGHGAWRLQVARWLLGGALVLGLLALAPTLAEAWGVPGAILISLLYVGLSAAVVLLGPFPLQVAGLVLVLLTLGLSETTSTGNPSSAVLYLLLTIVSAGLIWSLSASLITAALSLLMLGSAYIILRMTGVPALVQTAPLGEWIRAIVGIGLASIAMAAGLRQLQGESSVAQRRVHDALGSLAEERSTLEERVDARTTQWRAVLEVGRAASAIHDPEQLTAEVVNLISDGFGFYYAAIFLLNESGDTAVLHNATGEAGRLLKQNRHSLPVGGQSMVGTAISMRKPRVALDTDSEAVRFANPLLPYTRSEIAVPLMVGERVLGALDVQSTSPGAFGQAEIDTLQGMANHLAIAFENARLFQQSRQNVEELQAIQKQYIATAWEPLSQRGDLTYRMGEAESPDEHGNIEVSLSLRDQIIGEINLSGESDWTPEQRNLVEAVATQAALALENARLVESTQSTAQREHLLADITAKVWSTATFEAVLRTAVTELGVALQATEANIELRLEELPDEVLAYEYTPTTGTRLVRPSHHTGDLGALREPLMLRGTRIGTIGLKRLSGDFWTESERDLVSKTAIQVAQAIENVRLLEETRRRATEEQHLSELSASLSRAVDLDSLLQTAVRELAGLPDVTDASIFLSPALPGTGPITASDASE